MKAGGDRRFLKPLIEHLRHMPLADIDQVAIDNVAANLYPGAPPATLNRQVYTPISAVLKRAGIERQIKRPKGWRGRKLTFWLTPDQAFAVFTTIEGIAAPAATRAAFRVLLTLLCYTGMRLGDALGLTWDRVDLDARAPAAHLPVTKTASLVLPICRR